MDFNSISSKAGSMKRKQSTSLLQALGKPASRASAIPISPAYNTPPTATSSHFHDASTSSSGPYSPDIMTSGQYTDSVSSRAPSSQFNPPPSAYHYQNTQSSGSGSSYNLPLHSSRSVSGSGSMLSRESTDKGAKSTKDAQVIRRPDDVFRVVKERLFSWSYMMQWYQGDVHWLNTVKVTKSSLESSLGPAKVDQRARNFFVLGTSMSALFDINSVTDFLRSLLRLLDEWETFAEGGGKVKNLFRGQRGGRKPTGGPISDMSAGFNDGESLIVNFNLPFSPDFFQAHSSTCSIIRDLYKKILGMVLPAAPGQIMPKVVSTEYDALFHPSTVIHSAPLASPPLNSANPLSPGARSVSSQSQRPNYGQTDPTGGFYTPGHQNSGSIAQTPPSAIQHDAFQAHVAGELPENQVLVGDGQKLTPQVVELFIKVDTRLKKHFSILSREGDALARKVLVDELALITSSLKTGAPLKFDMTAALSSTGNGHWPDAAGGFDGAETPQTGSYGMY